VIPNGVDNFWIENKLENKIKPQYNRLNFLFVGEITLNKNLNQTIDLLKSLTNHYDINFTIIGKKLDGYKNLSKLVDKYSWLKYLDPIKDKNLLKQHYRNADVFIMLSQYETFGLVYIEALSQGTPILCTKGQGIDGYFPEGKVGYSFDIKNNSLIEFKEKVDLIIGNYENMSQEAILASTKFNWAEISSKYISIYES
jgi:glycosyltransferase involved in cell wall biosynthesis